MAIQCKWGRGSQIWFGRLDICKKDGSANIWARYDTMVWWNLVHKIYNIPTKPNQNLVPHLYSYLHFKINTLCDWPFSLLSLGIAKKGIPKCFENGNLEKKKKFYKQIAEIVSYAPEKEWFLWQLAGFSSKQMLKLMQQNNFRAKGWLSDGHLTSWQKYSNQGNKRQNGNLGS